MTAIFTRKWFLVLLAFAGVIWLFGGKFLMEMDWRELDFDSSDVEDLRRELASGQVGPRLKVGPCMKQATLVNLDLRLDGPFPIGAGRDVVMEVYLQSDAVMVDRVYLGAPVRHLLLEALPVCLDSFALPESDSDEAAFARITVDFVDLQAGRFLTFQGEDAFPILAWRRVRVDWSVMPWLIPGTESLSNIMVAPQQ